MKKNSISFFLLLSYLVTYSQWENLNSGISDNLTGIVFNQNIGLVSGENGLYYTLNGGNGSANWSRFEITDNTVDADIYNNTSFTNCYTRKYSDGTLGSIYACGQHSDGNAIIMRIELPSLEYQITKLLFTNAPLYDIDYRTNNTVNKYFAVGGNGIIVSFDNNGYDFGYSTVNDETFYTIDFAYNSPSAMIGSDNKYYKLNTDSYSFEEILTPNIINKDVSYSSTSYSVGNNYVKYYSGNTTIYNNYDFGLLNANCFVNVNGFYTEHLVGTDHGIFISDITNSFLEWQPSSQNYTIKSLWNETASLVYSCGHNGIILKTQNKGGGSKPYVVLDFDGGCVNQNIQFDTLPYGTSSNCQWYIDDVLFHSGCEIFYHTFNQVGEYEIKFIGTNNFGLQTEKTKLIKIVNPPEINKPTSIENQILCQENQLNIQIENSEPNVYYVLRKIDDNGNYGESDIGNGDTISFLSDFIVDSSEFYLEAVNIYSPNCNVSFTETFNIVVEKTEANFYVDLINANIDEEVIFYEKSTDSQNFEWTFNNATIETSNELNPINTFNLTGPTNVNLNCWSDNGCADDVTLSGPFIVEENNLNECWNIEFISNETNDIYPTTHIFSTTEINTGMLNTGYFKKEVFESTQGSNFNLDFDGGFLAKSDLKGVLKWIVYSTNGRIKFSAEDSNGNIFVTGYGDLFYDNKGDVYNLSDSNSGFLIKLDSRGNLVWKIMVTTSHAEEIKIDNADNLIVSFSHDVFNNFDHFVYLNGNQIYKINTIYIPVLKFSNDGFVIWEIGYTGGNFDKFSLDSQNNIYFTGSIDNEGKFYSNNDSTPHIINMVGEGDLLNMYVAKYNANGIFQWVQRSYVIDNGIYKSVFPYDMKTDDFGNIYILGSNYSWPDDDWGYDHIFENSDGSLYINDDIKPMFLQKISPDGICEWIVGVKSTFLGFILFSKLEYKNNKIYILSGFNTDNQIELTSINNNSVFFPFNPEKLFIASYNQNGTINKVIVHNDEFNGVQTLPYQKKFSGFIVVDDENFIISRNTGLNGDSQTIINGLNENCSLVYTPEILSINDNNKLLFSVFPNPTNDIIKINSENKIYKIEIFNKLGKLVLKDVNKEIVSLSNLAKGLYIIKIEDVKGNYRMKKIIKQ